MKFSLILCLFLLFACQPSKDKKNERTVVKEEVENTTTKEPEKKVNFDHIIESQFNSTKDCQKIFTGNKGNYTTAKLSYAKVFAYSALQDICGENIPGGVLDLFQQPSMGAKDALSLEQFNSGSKKEKGMDNLIATYALLYSLGQRESNGNFNQGRDVSASNTEAITEEAGLIQVSANSLNLKGRTTNSRLFLRKLFQEYIQKLSMMNRHERERLCLVKILGNDHESKNFDSSGKRLTNLFETGSCLNLGTNLKNINFPLNARVATCFKDLTKECPSFAIKYGGGVARIRRDHNGPLILHEEFREDVDQKFLKPYLEPACHNLFKEIVNQKDNLCQSSRP